MNALRRGADPFYFFLVIDYNYNPIKMFGGRKTYRKGRKAGRRGGRKTRGRGRGGEH